jgi:hypothetical protein
LVQFRALWFAFAVAFVVLACEVDSVASLEFAGRRYFGAVVHQITIQPSDLTRIGLPQRSNGLGPNQLEVFSLRGVDPTDIVIVRSSGSEEPRVAYLVFIRDGVVPSSTPPPSLFELVPSLCAYAKTATEGCA